MARFTIEDDVSEPAPQERFTISDDLPKNRMREAGKQLPSPMQGFVTAMQGPLFGFLDEITGGVQAGKAIATGEDPQKAYTQYRDLIRGAEQQYRQDYPTVSAIAPAMVAAPIYVAGPQIAMAPKAGATAAQNLGRAALGAGLTAAGYGAISALGESEGEGGNLLSDALKGAASSGVTGGATVPVAAILGKAAGGAGRMARRAVGQNVPADTTFAQRKVAEQLIRDTPESANIKKPLDRLLAYQKYYGNDAAIVDLGGGQTMSTLNTLSAMPGKTKEAALRLANERAAGRGAAIVREADKALGTGGTQYRQTIDELVGAREAAAKPLYQQLRSMTLTADDDLSSIINAARELGALKEARTMSTAMRQKFTLEDAPTQAGIPVGMADMDMVKRGLDQLVRKETDAVTGKVSPKGMAYQSLLVDLRNKLDDLTIDPQTGKSIYKSARDAFAGPSQLKEAAEIGRQAFSPDKEWKIADAIAGMSQSERDAMRIGLVQAVKEKAGTQAGQTWLMNNWKNPGVREKIQMAFGPDSGKFLASLQKQLKMKNITSGTSSGSQTAPLAMNAEDLGIEAVQDVANAAAASKTGNISGLWASLNNIYQRASLPEPVRNEMGRILLMKGPKARQELLAIGRTLEQLNVQQKALAKGGAFVGAANPWLIQGANNEQ